MRVTLIAVLLLAGCTMEPVSAPPSSTTPSVSTPSPVSTTPSATSESTSAEPAPEEPATEEPQLPAAKNVSCDDIEDVVDLRVFPETVGSIKAPVMDGLTACGYGNGNTVFFTAASDEESFAQRRDAYPLWTGNRFEEDPGFGDETYRAVTGAESLTKRIVATRQGSVEVWIVVGPPAELKSGQVERTVWEKRVFERLFELLC